MGPGGWDLEMLLRVPAGRPVSACDNRSSGAIRLVIAYHTARGRHRRQADSRPSEPDAHRNRYPIPILKLGLLIAPALTSTNRPSGCSAPTPTGNPPCAVVS